MTRKFIMLWGIGAVLLTLQAASAESDGADPKLAVPATTKSLEEQQSDFLKLKFGMFIHFNLAIICKF